MSPTTTSVPVDENDPLMLAIRPPSDETPEARAARLEEEAEAKKISDQIDDQIKIDNKKRKARAKREVKVLLLGQSESGKSTCLKQFQLLYAPSSFAAERESWKAVVFLNLVKSVRKVLDALSDDPISPVGSGHPSTDDLLDEFESRNGGSSKSAANGTGNQLQRSTTPISFSAGSLLADGRPSADSGREVDEFAAIKLRLSPLALAEELLIKRLAGDGEGMEAEATQLGSWSPYGGAASEFTTPSGGRIREVFVRSSSNWKKKSVFGKKGGSEESLEANGNALRPSKDDPFALIAACKEDIISLWKDVNVQGALKRKGIRLEEAPGFYLNDVSRLMAKSYIPSNQDVLNARLKTLGVVEHLFQLESGSEKGFDWRIYDVGGHRDQRHTWAPFFDDVNAIIFLAPISAFDQVLVEDKKVNRIEDSLLLFKAVCGNKLLGKVNIVLFLNKIDILKKKLKAGVRLANYVRSYGDRPNDFESVSQYFLTKFVAVHREVSPLPGRELYTHMTAVVDVEATAGIISDVRDMILRGHLKNSSLM